MTLEKHQFTMVMSYHNCLYMKVMKISILFFKKSYANKLYGIKVFKNISSFPPASPHITVSPSLTRRTRDPAEFMSLEPF